MHRLFVCLSVCLRTPLESYVLHGRRPLWLRLSPWALSMCAPTLPPTLSHGQPMGGVLSCLVTEWTFFRN